MSDVRVLTTNQLLSAAHVGATHRLNRQLDYGAIMKMADANGFHVFEVVLPFHEAFDKSLPTHHRVMGLIKTVDSNVGTEVIFDVLTKDWDRYMTPEVFAARMAKIDPDLIVSVDA